MNLFITGTDTGVGKTTVSAWICSQIQTQYWKIIQTGDDSDSKTVKLLAPNTKIIPEAYRLQAPLSPYDAAKLENLTIDVRKLTLSSTLNKTVIEGAGGIYVPITDKFFMLDALEKNNAEAVVVVRSKLGMINHLLLTCRAIRLRGVRLAAIIVVGNIESNILETMKHFLGNDLFTILPESDNLQEMFKQMPVPQRIKEILL